MNNLKAMIIDRWQDPQSESSNPDPLQSEGRQKSEPQVRGGEGARKEV